MTNRRFRTKMLPISNSSECSKAYCASNNWPIWTQKMAKEAWRCELQTVILAFSKILCSTYAAIGYQFWISSIFYSFKPVCLKLCMLERFVDIFDDQKDFRDWQNIIKVSETSVYTIVHYYGVSRNPSIVRIDGKLEKKLQWKKTTVKWIKNYKNYAWVKKKYC